MTADGGRAVLYSRLRELEKAACQERRKKGLPCSRREVANTAAREPFHVSLDAKRISSWVPATAGEAQVPSDPEPPGFLAMVQVWSAWAGRKFTKHEWVDLLAEARRERANTLSPAPAMGSTLPPAPMGFSGREDDLVTVLAALQILKGHD